MDEATASTAERRAVVLLRYPPLSQIPPMRTAEMVLVEGLLTKGLTWLVSPPKAGKTTLLTDIALALASGEPALGRYAVAEGCVGRVVYLVGEGQLGTYRARADQIVAARGLRPSALDNIHVRDARDFVLDDADQVAELLEAVESLRPTALILDPFSELHASDERSAMAMHAALAPVKQLMARFGTSVILAHHVVKNAIATAASLRGSGVLWAKADGCLTLNRSSDPDEVILSGEYRDAGPLAPVVLRRVGADSDATRYFEFKAGAEATVGLEPGRAPDVAAAVRAVLSKAAGEPMSVKKLAREVGRKDDVVGKTLRALRDAGAVICRGRGQWVLSVPVPGLDDCWSGNRAEPEIWDG